MVRKPMLRPVRGKAGVLGQSDMFPPGGADASGVWGSLLEASPWSNRPFRSLQNTPMLSYAEGKEPIPPEDLSRMWQPGWAGPGATPDVVKVVPSVTDSPVVAALGTPGPIIDVATVAVSPGVAPVDPPPGALPKPTAVKPPSSTARREKPRVPVPAKQAPTRVNEVPVENLLTGVVSLVGSGLVGAAGFAAYAGAMTASALGIGGKKKKPGPAKGKK